GSCATRRGYSAARTRTPLPAVLSGFAEPDATFTRDQEQARTELLAGGWVANTQGQRSRHGVTASFTLDYPSGDGLDAALAEAFVTDAKAVGVTGATVAVAPAQVASPAGTEATLGAPGEPRDPDP